MLCLVDAPFVRAHRLGTFLGTVGALFGRFVQKTQGKREKATVLLTVAFFNGSGARIENLG